VATTNKLSNVDSSVRRAGRFDRELEIGVPTAAERAAILRVLLRRGREKLIGDASLTEGDVDGVAAAAHGYVGADLALVCAEASKYAAKRAAAGSGGRGGGGDATWGNVTRADLMNAMGVIKPSAMREILVDIPKVSDVFGFFLSFWADDC
jgi:AAA family ATPase